MLVCSYRQMLIKNKLMQRHIVVNAGFAYSVENVKFDPFLDGIRQLKHLFVRSGFATWL